MAGELQGIGPYRLLAVIGEGERAVIYRAIRGDGGGDGVAVAIKVLRPFLTEDPDVADDLRVRATWARQLSHPNIVRGLESAEADGRPYSVGELCEGISLEDLPVRKKSGRLKPEPALAVLHGLLSALAAGAEAEGGPVIHGALDPGDILIDGTGDVRIIGFGVNGDPQTDLLAVGKIARELCRHWPMRVDAWVDRLRDGDDAFQDARAALEGFPMDAFPEVVLETGRTTLSRAVRRVLRRRVYEEKLPEEQGADEGSVLFEAIDTRAIAQATAVAWLCAAFVLLAVTMEIIRYGP